MDLENKPPQKKVEGKLSPRKFPSTQKKLPCEVCGKYFTKGNLKRHRIDVHKINSVACEICKQIVHADNLKIHMKLTHTHKTCSFCHKEIRNKYWSSHQNIHKADRKKPICYICGNEYSCKVGLNHHINKYHVKREKVICDICGYECYPERLKDHHLKEHEEKKTCPICSKKVIYLERHKQLFHGDVNLPKQKCELCDKEFSNIGNLNRHVKRLHHSEEND